jgi:hypothetical protein
VKPFIIGAIVGYVLACCFPMGGVVIRGGNLMGNAGGFTGGNPGVPQGPGFHGP